MYFNSNAHFNMYAWNLRNKFIIIIFITQPSWPNNLSNDLWFCWSIPKDCHFLSGHRQLHVSRVDQGCTNKNSLSTKIFFEPVTIFHEWHGTKFPSTIFCSTVLYLECEATKFVHCYQDSVLVNLQYLYFLRFYTQ